MKRVGIVDYGLGNLFSVQQALKVVGCETSLVSSPEEIRQMDALVLPGVGAFGEAMKELKSRHLDSALMEWVRDGKPLLGVCLGLQLLMDSSEEFGQHHGLGLIAGKVKLFPQTYEGKTLRVPHMGWEGVHFNQERQHPSLKGLLSGTDMYFVHSYYVEVADPQTELTSTTYEGLRYTSSVCQANIWAFQFHPEKSGAAGLQLYRNWVEFIS